MSERHAGWYWVKTIDHADPAYWEPAFFSNGEWDHDLAVKRVGLRIPTPDEPWQTVPVEPTPEMIEEGFTSMPDEPRPDNAAEVWRSMLAAAPTPGGGE